MKKDLDKQLKELLGEKFIVAIDTDNGVHCIASGSQDNLIDMLGSMCNTYLEEGVIDEKEFLQLSQAVINMEQKRKDNTDNKDSKKLLN